MPLIVALIWINFPLNLPMLLKITTRFDQPARNHSVWALIHDDLQRRSMSQEPPGLE